MTAPPQFSTLYETVHTEGCKQLWWRATFVGAWLCSFVAQWLAMTNRNKWYDYDGATTVASSVKDLAFRRNVRRTCTAYVPNEHNRIPSDTSPVKSRAYL
jgi:hypothetical protein